MKKLIVFVPAKKARELDEEQISGDRKSFFRNCTDVMVFGFKDYHT